MPKKKTVVYKKLNYAGSEPIRFQVKHERTRTIYQFASHEAAKATAMRVGAEVEDVK